MTLLPVVRRTVAALCAATALAVPAAVPAADSPDAGELYLDAIRTTVAIPVPPLLVFKEDLTGRNLHPICSPREEGGQFAVDGGGGRNVSTYELTFYANERKGSAENVRTHERCTGTGLFSPVASPASAASTQHGGHVSLDDVVGETLRDERATYAVALDGMRTVDGSPAWKLHLTLRIPDDGGDVAAEKTILVDEMSHRIREISARYGRIVWAGGAHVDIDAHLTPVDQYWLVTNWSLIVNARAIVVPLHFAFAARAYDFRFGAHRQAPQSAG